MSKIFDIILNTFYYLASINPSEIDITIKKDEKFQLALAFYIEYYGPHMRNLPKALYRVIKNDDRITTNINDLIKTVLHHTSVKPLAIYHCNKIYPQKKSSSIVLEIICFLISNKDRRIEDYIQLMNTHHKTCHKSFYNHDLDIRELMYHPFFGLVYRSKKTTPDFKEKYFNQIYWGNALLSRAQTARDFDPWQTLYATYIELMVQACLSNPPTDSTNERLYAIKHNFDRNKEIDTLNKILAHINGWASDQRHFNDKLMYAANNQRKTLIQTFFDDDTINLLIDKIQQNINNKSGITKVSLFNLKTLQNMTSSDLNAMPSNTITF